MVPMIDTLIPGMATAVLAVGPAFLGVIIALLAGVAWLGAGAAEELRRSAAREWDARTPDPAGRHIDDRLAA
jgi:hypothetical protein